MCKLVSWHRMDVKDPYYFFDITANLWKPVFLMIGLQVTTANSFEETPL